MKRAAWFVLLAIGAVALLSGARDATPQAAAAGRPALFVRIVVTNTDTGKAIRPGATLTSQTSFQVTVKTNHADCAGQFVATALGTPPAPPSVIVQAQTFIIGPAVGNDEASGPPLDSGLQNDWKVSATCNGARPWQFAPAFFEFFVDAS